MPKLMGIPQEFWGPPDMDKISILMIFLSVAIAQYQSFFFFFFFFVLPEIWWYMGTPIRKAIIYVDSPQENYHQLAIVIQ